MKPKKQSVDINREKINGLGNLKKFNSMKSLNTTNNSTAGDKDKDNKFFKFQNMSKLIVNKIDDILNQYPSNGVINSNIIPYSNVYSASKSLVNNLQNVETTLSNTDYRNTSSHQSRRTRKSSATASTASNNLTPVINTSIKETKTLDKMPKIDKTKGAFITDVNIEGTARTKYLDDNNKKIKEILDNVDDIDMDLEGSFSDITPEHRKDMMDFKNLIREVDEYKSNVKSEFDELQYLIKFVSDTSSKINRHKFGVSNVFTQSGLKNNNTTYNVEKKKKLKNEESEGSGDDDGNVYDKFKNMNKIKDNLMNIQGKVINFHQNFNTKMKKIEKKNNKYKSIIVEDGKEKLNLNRDLVLPDEPINKRK